MAKNNKKDKNSTIFQKIFGNTGDVNVSNNNIKSLSVNMANQSVNNFDCSANYFKHLAWAPNEIRGNFVCRDNKTETGEPNPLNRFHLGAGRFTVFNGVEDENINRPVKINGLFITDSGTYSNPKIYDCTVATTEPSEDIIVPATERSENISLRKNATKEQVEEFLRKTWISSGPGLHNPQDLLPSYEMVKFIVSFEGKENIVYDDGPLDESKGGYGKYPPSWDKFAKNPTIGIGHLISKSERSKWTPYLKGGGKQLTEAEIWLLKKEDMLQFIKVVKSRFNDNTKITQGMFDALLSLAFNTGAYSDKHTCYGKRGDGGTIGITKALNNGQYKKAAELLKTHSDCNAPQFRKGLKIRRRQEYEVFIKDGYVNK